MPPLFKSDQKLKVIQYGEHQPKHKNKVVLHSLKSLIRKTIKR